MFSNKWMDIRMIICIRYTTLEHEWTSPKHTPATFQIYWDIVSKRWHKYLWHDGHLRKSSLSFRCVYVELLGSANDFEPTILLPWFLEWKMWRRASFSLPNATKIKWLAFNQRARNFRRKTARVVEDELGMPPGYLQDRRNFKKSIFYHIWQEWW